MSTPTTSDQRMEQLPLFIPAGCDGRDYCDDSLDYPDNDTVLDIINNNNSDNHLLQLLFTQIGQLPDVPGEEEKIRKVDAAHDLVEYRPLCHSLANIVKPKTAKTTNNQWR